ncbi:MAG: MBL fold metallo-hydrolase [Saprospiraceae bacterium]|nr:MBL fold metallo-hydrolase [Saprospiraceae bacterium]
MEIKTFTFNDFYENTYLLYDKTLECVIIDPGCSTYEERKELESFIHRHELKPVHLLNTHCHIDHILGNRFVSEKYNLKLSAHYGEIPVLASGLTVSQMYQINYELSPDIEIFLNENDVIEFGNTQLDILFTPGHSPASISFLNKDTGVLIAGDVLFKGSIGRTDLPGGDYDTLINSVKSRFFTLNDSTIVYPGHGPETSIGIEKATNPFFR